MNYKLVLSKIAIVFNAILYCNSLQCVDEHKNDVDWYVIYKLPKIKNSPSYDGLSYIYMTSNNNSNWILSNYNINSSNSLLANTLKRFYESNSNTDISYILYNDEPPHGAKSQDKGHTKGVVMFDIFGFWLVHSIPHFPAFGKSYTYPETAVKYGQSILCISMNLTNINYVGTQLQYNEPKIYGVYLKEDVKQNAPEIWKAGNNITLKSAPYYNKLDIYSLNETKFVSFAKSGMFSKDLYDDFVAPTLQSDLLVETWPNERGRLKSDCSHKYSVKNVESIEIKEINISFTTTFDHSKWVISVDEQSDYICIGDINRAQHQLVRGGGTVCQQNAVLTQNYRNVINDIETCGKL